MIKSPLIKLSNGLEMPIFGLGTYKVPNTRESIEAIKYAIKIGYRLIDTATLYQNEGEIGIAIQECIADGIIKREDLFIVTKLWSFDTSPELVRDAVHRSLKLLQTSYIDLYLIHWPVKFLDHTKRDKDDMTFTAFPKNEQDKVGYSPDNITGVWKVLESLVDEGVFKSIGVSNFSIKKLLHLINNCRIQPVVNQIEIHPYFQQTDVLTFCENHKMKAMAYFPLSGSKVVEGQPKLLENPVLIDIAKKYNKTPAQICVKWALQRGEIVIPKSTHNERILENGQVFDFEIKNEDISLINSLNSNSRLGTGVNFLPSGSDYHKLLWEE